MSNIWWKTCLLGVNGWLLVVGFLSASLSIRGQEPPFSVPDGFVVQCVAEDRLVHDCFCMTLDGAGRPVISGPGYLRTLYDDQGDGVYDRAVDWTREIQQGAQGLWSDGATLYWVSDGGLWRSQDTDGDGAANAPAQRVMELPTGGEHDAHAIKRGPDGYWYLIAGNFAAKISQLANDPSGPVVQPRAGTLWRMSPDFSRRAVWAHGLRNAYDFDFLPDGQAVTYDSDDEREATLPWYRPTRAFVLGPGSDAGWCGGAWKDDDYRVTMPQVLARLGRGSPTGVTVYEHTSFPERYRDAVFVLDWTFGRVIAIYPSENLQPDERIANKIPSEIFMEPTGTAGFAPTSACVASDGSLLISVGGRGTMGAIYRVSYAPTSQETPSVDKSSTESVASCFASAVDNRRLSSEDAQMLESVIRAPAPWSAWSMAQWRPRVTPRLRGYLVDVALGEIRLDGPSDQAAKQVLRAAQILTRLGETVPPDSIQRGVASSDPAVRAAAWWLAGRQAAIASRQGIPRSADPTRSQETKASRWDRHLGASDQRLQWEAVGLKQWPMSDSPSLTVPSSPAGNALRRTWLWALSRSSGSSAMVPSPNRMETQIGRLLFGPDRKVAERTLLDAISQKFSTSGKTFSQRDLMEHLTSIQACLGDRRQSLPLQSDAPADSSDGYRGLYTGQIPESYRNNLARWVLSFAVTAKAQGWEAAHAESVRTMAMMEPSDLPCMKYLLEQVTADSHPTSDLHMLCSLAQCTAPRSPAATASTASALSQLVRKVKERGLSIDNQWPIRLNQLVTRLMTRDSQLGNAFIELPTPCCEEELVLLQAFPTAIQNRAREKIRAQLRSAPPEEWTLALVKFGLTGPVDNAFRNAMKKGCGVESLRQSCLGYLAQSPQASDYEWFLDAMEDSDRTLWPDAWRGLVALEIREPSREFPALAKLVSASMNSGMPLQRPLLFDRVRRIAASCQRAAPPTTEFWSDWGPYLQSQLDEAQWASLVLPSGQTDVAGILKSIEGLTGDAPRGARLFQAKCGLCHGSQSALGPSLVGVSKRFSRNDLAIAIYEPSRDVPDRYRAVRVLTIDDEVLTGMSIYTSADGVTLQVADGSIVRVNQDQIQQKAFSTESIMPSGLLDDRSPQDVSDLFAYLATLQ